MFEDNIKGLAVDDIGGFMYWIEYTRIRQASLDGSNATTLLETGKLTVICKRIHRIIVTEHPLYHRVQRHPLYHLVI